MADAQVAAIAHVIQLAVAPVFLISGISGMLGVLVNRLARVVDRGRKIEELLATTGESPASREAELRALAYRARLTHLAIGFCAICALLICTVVVVLFVGASLSFNVAIAISWLFVGAMSAFIAALLCFLREIQLATSNLRIGT
ncbi:MAG: DUF2721 domain-containing protein [Stenotrophobium sp.]